MNRNDEFEEFMKELDERIPAVDESIKKGSRRKARKQFLYQPLMGMATVFMLFVLSVNLCAPVAMAFSKVPVLKDLTKAVAFSKSLRDALENDYVQDVYQIQSKDGVTVEVTAMIVDQKRLTVFYQLTTELDAVAVNCNVSRDAEGDCYVNTHVLNMLSDVGFPHMEGTQSVSIDFLEEMPEMMPLCMTVWDMGAYLADVEAGVTSESNDLIGWEEQAEQYEITSFLFELDMDLAKIPETKTYDVNQTVELSGQMYTITNIVVHPTYMDINIVPDKSNTALLRYLYFYVENENGEVFYDNRGGRSDFADWDEAFQAGAESSYFYEGDLTKMVITGGVLQENGKEKSHVNLVTGEAENLPENIALKEIVETDEGYNLVFGMQYMRRANEETGELYGRKCWMPPFMTCCDETGKQYYCDGEYNVETDENDYLVGDEGEYVLCLEVYPYEEVWMENHYSSIWYPEEEVSVIIK